jgi:hypothetical protein
LTARHFHSFGCLCSFTFALVFLYVGDVGAFEHRQGARVGAQIDRFRSASAGAFVFYSPFIGYEGRYGADWAASLKFSYLVPVHASDGVSKFAPSRHYDQVRSFDAFVGVDRRFARYQGWSFEGALGPHGHFTRLRSSRYVEWSSASMGVGMSAAASRPSPPSLKMKWLHFGAQLDLSYDFVDFSHGGDLSGVFSAALSFSLAFVGGVAP